METWEYLQRFGKPITKEQLDFRRLNNIKNPPGKLKLITETDYKKMWAPMVEEKTMIGKGASVFYSKIPWISSMMITGSVASGYPGKNDDIDIMFICQKNSIWVCRVLVYAVSLLVCLPIRRTTGGYQNKLCLNLWVEEDYVLNREKQNLANAMDSILAKPIFGAEKYSNFLAKNRWIGRYVSFGYKSLTYKHKIKSKAVSAGIFIATINRVLYCLLNIYMKKTGNELVSLNKAFFHP